MQPVGAAAAVVQVLGIIKVRTYQSTMSLVVIVFTYFEGKDGELVVKELAAVNSHSNRVSS